MLVTDLITYRIGWDYYIHLMEVYLMAVLEVGEKYTCNICGNEVVVTQVGGGTLVCCGEDMQLVK